MATVHIDINVLTNELAVELAKLGRALTAIELHHFIMDRIGEKYPQMLQGQASRLTHEVMATMNAYRFEAEERNPFANTFGGKHFFTSSDWGKGFTDDPEFERFKKYCQEDVKNAKAFNERMYRQYAQGSWGGDGDASDNEGGSVDFDEDELIDAFTYAGHVWKAPKRWRDYRLSRGDFMGGFTRIPAGARINSRIFEPLPFTMIKN